MNKYNTHDDNDEEIEIDKFEYSAKKMILSESDKEDILRSGKGFMTEVERLSRLFAYIRTCNAYEFRKVLSEDRSVINSTHNKTYLIHEACKRGATDIVTFLLFSNADCHMADGYGLLPQHYSVVSNAPVIIDILSVFGHDLNVIDDHGNTPLHHAVKCENKIMIHMLLNYKVDSTIKNVNGKTAFDLSDNSVISIVLKDYSCSK
jgi:ankyrin repeat protein